MNKTVGILLVLILLTSGTLLFGLAARQATRRQQAAADAQAQAAAEERLAARTRASWLKEYELTDQTGQSFGTRDLKGQVHVVSFFFATCPSICRMQNQKIQLLVDEFGKQGVKFVSITCDPEQDTPSALNAYSRLFQADPEQWKFLTGDLGLIRRIGAEIYAAIVDRQTHSEKLLVVDRQGEIRGRFHWNRPEETEAMKALLSELLRESAESPGKEADPEPGTTPVTSAAFDEETGRLLPSGEERP